MACGNRTCVVFFNEWQSCIYSPSKIKFAALNILGSISKHIFTARVWSITNPRWILIIAQDESLLVVMDALKQVYRRCRMKKLLSHSHDVTGGFPASFTNTERFACFEKQLQAAASDRCELFLLWWNFTQNRIYLRLLFKEEKTLIAYNELMKTVFLSSFLLFGHTY